MLTVSTTIQHGSEANAHLETNENRGRRIVKETKLFVDGKAIYSENSTELITNSIKEFNKGSRHRINNEKLIEFIYTITS